MNKQIDIKLYNQTYAQKEICDRIKIKGKNVVCQDHEDYEDHIDSYVQ